MSIELFGHFLSLEPSLAGVWLEATNRRSRPTIYQWQDVHQQLTSTWRAACWKIHSSLIPYYIDNLRLVLVDPQHGLQNKFHWSYSFAAPNSISKHLLHTSAAQSAKCSFPQQQGTKEVSWSQSMTPISTNHGVCLELCKVQQWPSSFVKYMWWCISSLEGQQISLSLSIYIYIYIYMVGRHVVSSSPSRNDHNASSIGLL